MTPTAELPAGELVSNAVLHARTEIEVRAWADDGRVAVRVSDRRPERGLVPHERHPYACTGRGLALVEELASSHGVRIGEDHKTVWFELWPEAPAPPASAWEAAVPSGRTATVTLIDLPYALYRGAQQHGEGLLRELQLAAAYGACPLLDVVAPAAKAAIRALGITAGVSHVEIRLVDGRPRIVEVNGRLAGDMISHLVHLATGGDRPRRR